VKNAVTLTLLLLWSSASFAEDSSNADIIRGVPGIAQLQFDSVDAPITVETTPDKNRIFATVRGKLSDPNGALLYNTTPIQLNAEGEFKMRFQIFNRIKELNLTSVAITGETQHEKFKIQFSAFKEIENRHEKRYFLIPSLGYSSISYMQLGIPNYSESVITAKFAYQYPLSQQWDFTANLFGTVLFLSSSDPNSQLRFIGANARANYHLPFVQDPWRFYLGVGAYYTTTIVQQSSFGYANLAGPSVLATIKRASKGGSSITAYGKFSPVAPGFSVLNPNNREFAYGLGYSLPSGKTNFITFNLDFANLQLMDIDNVPIHATSTSLSFGFGF